MIAYLMQLRTLLKAFITETPDLIIFSVVSDSASPSVFKNLTYSPRLCSGFSHSVAIPCFSHKTRKYFVTNVCNLSRPILGSFLSIDSEQILQGLRSHYHLCLAQQH